MRPLLAVIRWFATSLEMSLRNIFTAFVQIWAGKGRSLLTTLGVIIAVTSIITVITFVEGFGSYVDNMMRGYGTQYIIVHPFRRGGQIPKPAHLTLEDLSAVRRECRSVRRMSPFIYTGASHVTYRDNQAREVPLRGVSEHYQTIRNYDVDRGRFLGPMDIANHAQVVVIGRSVLRMLESDEDIIGDYVQVDNRRFKVIGVLESKGSFMGDDQDLTLIIPYTTALKLFPDRRETVSFLAEASSVDEIDAAANQIQRVLRQRHRIQPQQPDDFALGRQDQFLAEQEKATKLAGAVLGGIVGISLLVGGIGIMNVMLVSVTERTREIGLRKSLGGRRRDILLQFLTEAVVLCTLGGLIGVALGYAVTAIAGLHPQMVQLTVPWWSVILALTFSAGTGVVFGIVPAFKAAILNPIDALRHE